MSLRRLLGRRRARRRTWGEPSAGAGAGPGAGAGAGAPNLQALVPIPVDRGPRPRPAPDVVGSGLDGRELRIPVSRTGSWWLILFLSTDCLGCEGFWDATRDGSLTGLGTHLEVAVVTRSADRRDVSAVRRDVSLEQAASGSAVPVVVSDTAWTDYQVQGPPFFVVAQSGRVVTEGVAVGVEQVVDHVRRAREPLEQA